MDTGLQRSPDARDRAREERLRDRERRTGAPDARLLASRWGRALVAAVGLLAALTVAGLVFLWPHGGGRHGPSDAMGGATEGAVVTRVQRAVPRPCGPALRDDRRPAGSGGPARIDLGPAATVAPVGAGTRVRVQRAGARMPTRASTAARRCCGSPWRSWCWSR